jgi:hypothetical protein
MSASGQDPSAEQPSGSEDLIPCPHCGGEIKQVAKICKHCKRDPQAVVAPAPAPPAPKPPEKARPKIIDQTLRNLLVGRKLVSREAFEQAANGDDAAAVIAALAANGELTAAQADAQREAFREAQKTDLKKVVDDCVRRGFTTAAASEPVFGTFERCLFSKSPVEHLIAEGLITAKQAEIVGSLNLGLVGESLARGASQAVRSASTVVGSERSAAAMDFLKSKKGIGMAAAAVLVIAAFTFIGGAEPPEFSAPMDRYGRGQLIFTNTTSSSSSSICGKIVAWCRSSTERRSSATFCSGVVPPGETVVHDFAVTRFQDIRGAGDWPDGCSHDFFQVTDD